MTHHSFWLDESPSQSKIDSGGAVNQLQMLYAGCVVYEIDPRTWLWIPGIVSLLSLGTLILRVGLRRALKRRGAVDRSGVPEREIGSRGASVVERNGGLTIFWWMVARALGCLALVGLSVLEVLRSHSGVGGSRWSGRGLQDSILESLVLSNLYAFILSCLAITATTWRDWSIRHNIAILASELAVYVYRDLWPLATYMQNPMDADEGWIIWAKIGILAFTAVVVPACIPTLYFPVDPKYSGEHLHPEQTASIISSKTYAYLTPTIATANNVAHLTPDLMPPIADYDTSRVLATRSHRFLNLAKIREGRHIGFGLIRFFATDYFVAAVCTTIYAACQLGAPVAINRLLVLLESGKTEKTIVRPWFWIFCLLVVPIISSLSFHSYVKTMTRTMARLESILTQLLFDFSLQIRVAAEHTEAGSSSDSKQKGTSSVIGKINNLATVDIANTTATRDLVLVVWYLPIQVTLSSIFLYLVLGWSAFVGLALMVALLPVPGYLTTLLRHAQVEKMKKTDQRTQLVTETMNVLRTIKLFGWEGKFEEKIAQRRDEELLWVWKGKLLNLIVMLVNNVIPTLTMLATYATATLVMRIELTASIVFSSILVFDSLRNEIQAANSTIGALVRGKVSLDRINDFFKETELLHPYEASHDLSDPPSGSSEDNDVYLRNTSFMWSPTSETEPSTPGSFRLTVPREIRFVEGGINLIIGPTGAGKTSLLMALLGEMGFVQTQPDSAFNLPRTGGVALAVQESWVQNETIRDNILFHSPFEEERYKKVLCQCALEPDLELFEAGDLTEVGERGLTLSGGQKARLTLARAIYSKAQVILLDDVLAALDVHTAKWIVDKCLKGDLVKGRTILLITHNIALVRPIADFVVSIDSNGVATGHGRNLMEALEVEAALREDYEKDKIETWEAEDLVDKPSEKDRKAAGKLILEEEVQQGDVSWKAWRLFFNGSGGEHTVLFATVLVAGQIFEGFILNFNLWFLGYWSSQYENHPASDVPVARYLGTYVGLTLIWVANNLSKDVWYTLGTLRASRTIHRLLAQSILGATLRWLDETPVARVITRMTLDIGSVDGTLVFFVDGFISLLMTAVNNLIGAVFFVPIFMVPGLVVAAIGTFTGRRYMKAQLSVRRELSKAKAPMLSHFSAAMTGLVSIRAYGAEESFKDESRRRTDHYVRIARLNYDLNRWIGVRIDSLGAVFTGALAAYLTYGSTIKAANIGFSLNKAVEFATWTLHLVLVSNLVQVEATSLERIAAFTEIEQEPKPTESGKPPASWPTSGDIQVENLTARYSKSGPAVLHDLSFRIRAGERIGVVGRTGGGKSSLTLALLRAIVTKGTVYFDGLPTDQVNLDALRSRITMIPQSPELLSGTLRFNLDPFDEYDDATLNNALNASGLLSTRAGSEDDRFNLDSIIASGGANVSAGQRQIISLARAIVRSSKFLILDEATSAIDHETDSIIQNTLRRELGRDVTVLTIAHRLQTIMDADRIMVLDAGRIVEFASPTDLLSKEHGAFKALVDGSGDRGHLYELVKARSSN